MSAFMDSLIATYATEEGMIRPFRLEQLQPASYDLTLGRGYRVSQRVTQTVRRAHPDGYGVLVAVEYPAIDLREDVRDFFTPSVEMDDDGILVAPYSTQLLLLHTEETITLPTIVRARVEGKSSLGRIGLVVHNTAGFIDPGFSGQVTLEVTNVHPYNPIRLYPGMPIAQINFDLLIGEAVHAYGEATLQSHYQGQTGATLAVGGRGKATVP